MGQAWKILSALTSGTAQAANAVGRAVGGQVEAGMATRGGRVSRDGVLGPGDPPPPPHAGGLYDYRGLVPSKTLRKVDGAFPLGRLIDPHRGPISPLGIDSWVLEQHAAIIGPTGAGKTSSLIVPWIAAALRAGHCAVAIDVTGNLVDKVVEYAQRTGPLGAYVAQWDFTQPSRSASWNWLADLGPGDDGVVAAVEALIGRDNPNDPQPFFAQRDKRVLRGLIEAVIATGQPSVSTLVAAASDQSLVRRLAALGGPGVQRRLSEVATLPAADFPRAMSGVVNAVDIFEHAGVRAVTSRQEITLAELTTAPALLVIGAPLSGSRTSVALSSLMLSVLTRQMYTRFGQAHERRMFYFVDEAARLADRVNFEELLSVSRTAGISVVLAAQNVAQFADKSERATILDNCATYVALPSVSDESATYFASRLGSRDVPVVAQNRTVGSFSSGPTTQFSHSLASVPVLGKREIMDPPWGPRSALVHCSPLVAGPFAVDLTRPDLSA